MKPRIYKDFEIGRPETWFQPWVYECPACETKWRANTWFWAVRTSDNHLAWHESMHQPPWGKRMDDQLWGNLVNFIKRNREKGRQ